MRPVKRVAAVCAATILACNTDAPILDPPEADPPPAPPLVASELSIVSDSIIAGSPGVDIRLEVVVRDQHGMPMPNAPIRWQLLTGHGELSDPWSARKGNPITTVSISGGMARAEFRPLAPGRSEVIASVGSGLPAVRFLVDLDTLLLFIAGSLDDLEAGFYAMGSREASTDFTVPFGTTIRWVVDGWSTVKAHVASLSAPAPDHHFDSGTFGYAVPGNDVAHETCCFTFVPVVAGTWEFIDRISGVSARLQVESPLARGRAGAAPDPR